MTGRLPIVALVGVCLVTGALRNTGGAGEAPRVQAKTILFIGGREGHPPGTHEALASLRLLLHCVDKSGNLGEVSTGFYPAWPKDEDPAFDRSLAEADCLVFCGDNFPVNRRSHGKDFEAQLARIDAAAKRGAGIVILHFAAGAKGKEHKLLEWTGGYFAAKVSRIGYHGRVNTIARADTDHAVLHGWKEFKVKDELYLDYWHGEGGLEAAVKKGLTPIARSSYAGKGEEPKPYVVAWAWQRSGGGRGFVTWATHYFRNWRNEDLRRMTLNGIAWSAGMNVPEEGVKSTLPADLSVFEPKPKPKPKPKAKSGSRQ